MISREEEIDDDISKSEEGHSEGKAIIGVLLLVFCLVGIIRSFW